MRTLKQVRTVGCWKRTVAELFLTCCIFVSPVHRVSGVRSTSSLESLKGFLWVLVRALLTCCIFISPVHRVSRVSSLESLKGFSGV